MGKKKGTKKPRSPYVVGLILSLIVSLPAMAQTVKSPEAKSTLTFGAATAAVDSSDLLNYKERSKRWYGALELPKVGEGLTISPRVEVSRDETAAKSWAGSAGVNLHLGPIAFPVSLEYSQLASLWSASAGAGIQACSKVCLEALVKYHLALQNQDNPLDVGTVKGSGYYSLQVGAGFEF